MNWHTVYTSPIGPLTLVADECGLRQVHMGTPDELADPGTRDDEALGDATKQLREYFAGERTAFDLALATSGSDFQRSVWQELSRIGYGETISYSELARRIGKPGASRAVGLANGRNPLAIIVPCHRVIGVDGSLTGYAGGVNRKRQLLELEARTLLEHP